MTMDTKRHSAAQAKVKRDKQEEKAEKPSRTELKRKAKGKLSKGGKIAFVVVACAAMVLSVTAMACTGLANEKNSEVPYELTGGVAATVNGVNIKEDTITKQVMSTRESLGYEDDADWAKYLADQGLTPETYRENLIDGYARQYLLSEAEQEHADEVTEKDVDKAWDEAVSSFGDEDGFRDYLSQMGFTEESYRESLKSQLAADKLKEDVAPAKKVSDEDLIAYVNGHLATYNDARRSSHILIKVDSDASEKDQAKAEEKANKVLEKINSGEMDFDEAAKKYSDDTSASKGGDVGWDKLTTFVTEYQDALSALSEGQVSGVVKTDYGYHIIKCTGYFHVDGQVTSVDQIPEDLRDEIVKSIQDQQVSEDYAAWQADYIDKADIKVNDMPENVPYNVDMDLAKSAQDPAAASGDTDDKE